MVQVGVGVVAMEVGLVAVVTVVGAQYGVCLQDAGEHHVAGRLVVGELVPGKVISHFRVQLVVVHFGEGARVHGFGATPLAETWGLVVVLDDEAVA